MSQSSQSTGLIQTAEETYNKVNPPSLPASIKELIVTFAPWLALLSGVLGLLVFPLGILVTFILAFFSGMGGGGLGAIFLIIHVILLVVGAVLSLMSFNGLRSRNLTGWTRMFWSTAVYLVAGLLPLSLGGIISTIIGGAVALYILFQTKPYYDGTVVAAAANPATV